MAEAFLIVNGFVLNFSNNETYDLVLRVAEGAISKEDLAEVLEGAIGFREAVQTGKWLPSPQVWGDMRRSVSGVAFWGRSRKMRIYPFILRQSL